MPEIKDGYKIVEIANCFNNEPVGSMFYSVTLPFYKGGLEYIPYRWTVPQNGCGDIAVFDDLKDAIRLAERWGYPIHDIAIFKCKYTESDRHELFNLDNRVLQIPKGTVFASSAMITEMLTDNWKFREMDQFINE